MGGFIALVAAARLDAAAVVAICPAGSDQLRRGLRDAEFDFHADAAGLDALLEVADERGRGARRSAPACCSCTPRATSACPSRTRARCTPGPPAAGS